MSEQFDKDWKFMKLAAIHGRGDVLDKIHEHPVWKHVVSTQLTWNRHTPEHVLRDIYNHDPDNRSSDIAQHPNTPPDVIHDIVTNGYGGCFVHASKNPNTAAHTLHLIATILTDRKYHDRSGDVIMSRILTHPNANQETKNVIDDHMKKDIR